MARRAARRMTARNQTIAIVGPGRVGQALGRLLVESGFPVSWIAARRPAAARAAVRFIGAGQAVNLNAPQLASASIVLLTTSDSVLAPVARHLASLCRDWSGCVVLHTSGSVPSTVLSPLKKRVAAIGSLHPFQTIPSPAAGVRSLRGCFWGIEGDPAARRVAMRIVKALGGHVFSIRPEKKILYHAAAFLVCPAIVALMEESTRLLAHSGIATKLSRPMLGQIVAETVRNYVAMGGRRALTGPAARGDWPVIRRHLAALRREFPDVVPLYKELVRDMLRLAGRKPLRALL